MWYVNDTPPLVKDKYINYIHKHLIFFDKNVKFTVGTFPNCNVNFLDIKVDENNTDIYCKDTHTEQYTSFHSQTPWHFKTAWMKALFHRANKICSSKQAFQQQINHTKTLMSWNAYPKYVCNSVTNRLKSNANRNDNINNNKDDRFLGKKGE